MLNLCVIIQTLNILGLHHSLDLVSTWALSVDCCFRYFDSSFGFNQFWNTWTLKRGRPVFFFVFLSSFITSPLLLKLRENYLPDQSLLVSRDPAIPILPCGPENFIRISWFLFIPKYIFLYSHLHLLSTLPGHATLSLCSHISGFLMSKLQFSKASCVYYSLINSYKKV